MKEEGVFEVFRKLGFLPRCMFCCDASENDLLVHGGCACCGNRDPYEDGTLEMPPEEKARRLMHRM